MDNQKSNDGNARNMGSEGAGSSMGKDMGSSNMGSTGAPAPMVDRLASSAHEGVDKVQGALTGVSARVDEKTKQLGEAYNKFAETGRGYVRSSPATSVLVAVGAGFILSKLLSRRH